MELPMDATVAVATPIKVAVVHLKELNKPREF